jgi:hypothetical protein
VTSRTSARFRLAFRRLPGRVQKRARAAYRLFQREPSHPALRFKLVHPTRPIYSVRIGLAYRALGVRDGDEIIWFWSGSHTDYDRLLRELPPRPPI